ncbi:hypothetical protein [Klebsiella phage Kpn74]|uniref:Uncharacterized protein n=1 Tax=Klebsiella phage Kpn74 TaxID=3044026 RepID=A0AAT9V5C6_9CAUD|nr:hypothetical protein [Klebsiella phage Kpn74]
MPTKWRFRFIPRFTIRRSHNGKMEAMRPRSHRPRTCIPI